VSRVDGDFDEDVEGFEEGLGCRDFWGLGETGEGRERRDEESGRGEGGGSQGTAMK